MVFFWSLNMDFVEKRRFYRIINHSVVSYHATEGDTGIDITQAKNISLAGVLFTTGRSFSRGAELALKIKLPISVNPVNACGRVVESREIIKGIIYDTRIEFSSLSKRDSNLISETICNYMKEQAKTEQIKPFEHHP